MKAVLASLKPVHWVIIAVAFLGSCTVCGVVGMSLEEPASTEKAVSSSSEPVAEPTAKPQTPCQSYAEKTYFSVQGKLMEEVSDQIGEMDEAANEYLVAIVGGVDTAALKHRMRTRVDAIKQTSRALKGYKDVPDSLKSVDNRVDTYADAISEYVESIDKAVRALDYGIPSIASEATDEGDAAQKNMEALAVHIGNDIQKVCGDAPSSFK